MRKELDSLPEILALPGTSSIEGSRDVTVEPCWCHCTSRQDVLYSNKSISGFCVNMDGLITPPCVRCSICRTRKPKLDVLSLSKNIPE